MLLGNCNRSFFKVGLFKFQFRNVTEIIITFFPLPFNTPRVRREGPVGFQFRLIRVPSLRFIATGVNKRSVLDACYAPINSELFVLSFTRPLDIVYCRAGCSRYLPENRKLLGSPAESRGDKIKTKNNDRMISVRFSCERRVTSGNV